MGHQELRGLPDGMVIKEIEDLWVPQGILELPALQVTHLYSVCSRGVRIVHLVRAQTSYNLWIAGSSLTAGRAIFVWAFSKSLNPNCQPGFGSSWLKSKRVQPSG